MPAIVRASAISSAAVPGSQYERSQATGTLMPSRPELLQQPHVVLPQHAQVRHAVLERRDPLDPEPEGEALHPLRVVAVPGHVAEHVWIDHPGAEDLDPALSLAGRA